MDTFVRITADILVFAVIIVGVATFILSVRTNRYQRYMRAFMAGLTSLTVAKLLSLFYISGERPFEELSIEPVARTYLNNPGFPSDHALLAFTIALVVWAATRRTKLSLLLLALSLLVGVGRVVGLVHTTTDIIGAAAAAIIGVGLWYGPALFKRTLQ